MPQQLYCAACTCRTFYLMAQDDGSIDAFCQVHNHKRVLVNIPALVQHILKVQDGQQITDADRAALTDGTAESPEIQNQAKTYGATIQHGASGESDL